MVAIRFLLPLLRKPLGEHNKNTIGKHLTYKELVTEAP